MLQVRKEEGRSKVKLPKATLGLIFLNIILYLLASGQSSFFVLSASFLESLSLQVAKPLSIFTYMFIHLWPSHLAVDCLLLLFFGWIVEREVGFSKTLATYLVAGAVSGALHLLVSPATKLVGSSGAVFGMVGASIVIAPVSAFAAFVLLAYGASPLIISEVEGYGEDVSLRLEDESKELSEDYSNLSLGQSLLSNELESKRDVISSIEGDVEEKEGELQLLEQRREEVGEETYQLQHEQLSEEKQQLEDDKADEEAAVVVAEEVLEGLLEEKENVSKELKDRTKKISDYSIFKALRDVTTESEAVHLAGLFTGYLFLVIIEPSALGRYNGFLEVFRRKKKKARHI